jgi:hypothetical protein
MTQPSDKTLVQVSGPVHGRLTQIKAQMKSQLGRDVTFTEVLERLLERWDQRSEP